MTLPDRRGFLEGRSLETVRTLRGLGELALWRARAAGPGARRAELLLQARFGFVSAASIVRRARLQALSLWCEAQRVVDRANARTRAYRGEGPDA